MRIPRLHRMILTGLAAAWLIGPVTARTHAQSITDRIEQARRDRGSQAAPPDAPPTPADRMRDIVDIVTIEEASARRALQWWSTTTHIPLVIDWDALQDEGIDPQQPMNLRLANVPAGQLLGILLTQLAPRVELMYEVTPWYVQVTTKQQANRNLVLRVYIVEDLVMAVPNFEGPTFDLNDALSNTSSGGSTPGSRGGGNAGGGGGLFPDDTDMNDQATTTKAERGDQLATTVMETIEPQLWIDVPGASVKYFNARLIVNAPRYVHDQIGMRSVGGSRPAGGGAAAPQARARGGVGDLDPIGGVAKPTPIAGIQGR